jgi:cellulose biosynthesis protein BcsQ
LDNIKRHLSKRIAIYNHKGGVGKTTLTVNIAAAIASLGRKVLLIDSDPQCNLTSYLIEDSVVDNLLDNSDKAHGRTIWSALKPVSEGIGDVHLVEPYETSINNLFILPGDILLSEYERDLTQSWSECFEGRIKGYRGTTALSLLVNHLAEKYQIDYVFYDLGPNIGPLNRVILLDCDFFIVPLAFDLFSLRALKTLGHTLIGWIRNWKTISELAPRDIYLFEGKPRFLGFIVQRFRIYRGQIAKGQASYLSKIKKTIYSEIVAVLGKLDPLLILKLSSGNELEQVKDFGSLAAEAQKQGVPIANIKTGTPAQRKEAKKTFESLAKKIIQRTSKK